MPTFSQPASFQPPPTSNSPPPPSTPGKPYDLSLLPAPVLGAGVTWSFRIRWVVAEGIIWSMTSVGMALVSGAVVNTGVFKQMVSPGGLDPLDVFMAMNTVLSPIMIVTYAALTQIVPRYFTSLRLPVPSPRKTVLTRFSRSQRIRIAVASILSILLSSSLIGFSFFVASSGEVTQLVEDRMLMEAIIDSENATIPFAEAQVCVFGPLNEELLCRGLLLARIARVFGAPIAVIASGVVFGLAHAHKDADKVTMTTIAGIVLGSAYAYTQSLIAVTMLHSAFNSVQVLFMAMWNPMRPIRESIVMLHERMASGEGSMVGQFADVIRKQKSTFLNASRGSAAPDSRVQKQIYNLRPLLSSDLTALSPALHSHALRLFRTLDRGGKGYLSVEEWAVLMMLQEEQSVVWNAQCSILARRANPARIKALPAAERAEFIKNFSVSSGMPELKLPHEVQWKPNVGVAAKFKNESDKAYELVMAAPNLDRLSQIGTPQMFRPFVGAVETELTTSVQQMRARQWYSLIGTVEYLKLFHSGDIAQTTAQARATSADGASPALDLSLNGCTEEKFLALVARRILLNPELGCQWLGRATKVLSGEEQHPSTKMWQMRMPKAAAR